MTERKYIKLPRIDGVFESKQDAIDSISSFISQNIVDFNDGEELLVRFKDNDNTIISTNVVVNINDNEVTLSFSLDSDETIRIVEGEEPNDKNALWLSDDTDPREVSIFTLQKEVELLKKTISDLKTLIHKHEYAFTHTLSGGDFLTNSLKNELSNRDEQEKPIDSVINEDYATEDLNIVRFELFIANTNLEYYTTSGKLYIKQFYYLKPKFYNISDQLIKPDSGVTLDIETKNPDIAIAEYYDRSKKWYLYGNKSGATDVTATVTLPDGNILNKEYTLVFKYNQEIDYEEYYEPNVKHILVKTADNFDLLSANTDYLLLNELVWCIGDNSLYFKAQSSTGAIGLFKINGGGVTPTPTPPSPTGTTISFEIADNGILDIEDKSTNKQISITEEGILELVGTFDGDTLILNNSGESKGEIKIEGDDLVITNVTVSEDGIIDFGDLTVDDEGYIIMN